MEENRDAILGKIAVAAGVGFEELDLGIHALCGGVGERCFVVASNPGRWRLRVFAAAMMGGSREWVAQKYRRLSRYLSPDHLGRVAL